MSQRGGSHRTNENVTKSDETIICEWYNTPLVNSQGEVIAIASMILDITERKQAEKALQYSENQLRQQTKEMEIALRELQRTQAQLIQSEKMSSLGQLVAGIAHEINNPISFIHGNLKHATAYAEELMHVLNCYQKHCPEPSPVLAAETTMIDLAFIAQDFPRLLNSMNVGTERIRNIVLSLRNFSRLDESEVKAVDIHDGLDNTLMILQHRLKAQSDRLGIQVVKNYDLLPHVECYAGLLNQVFVSILTNAIDALEEKFSVTDLSAKLAAIAPSAQNLASESVEVLKQPTITIRTESLSLKQVAIHIIDNGMGMSEGVKNRLFDPFFTTKPVGKGTGLGLSISHQTIVEKHHGQLHCYSALGSGTEFIITLPTQLDSIL
jgi:two-component system, NtrC family, sensor kinase